MKNHSKVDHSKLIYEVLAVQNDLRTNPQGFIRHLENHIKLFKGNVFYYPGEIAIMTNEGVAAVKEAIHFLEKQKPLGMIEMDENLCKAARDHAEDTGPKGITGHDGSDGSSMSDRVERYCEWEGGLCENIDYGEKPALRIIMSLLIDDGVKSRGHRTNLFNPDVKFAGIACGYHKKYGMLTVCDYSNGIGGKKSNSKSNKNQVNYEYPDDDYYNNKEQLNNIKLSNNRENFDFDENEQDYENFDDDEKDPDFPKGAISSNISVSTKTCNGKTITTTIKTYTFPDGSTMTSESTKREYFK